MLRVGTSNPGNNQVYVLSYVAAVLLDILSNEKSFLKTWRSLSSISKYCVAASRTEKDNEEVKEGEDKGRTEMRKSRIGCSSAFPFHGVRIAEETKAAPVRLL